jgi:hypothetical protein
MAEEPTLQNIASVSTHQDAEGSPPSRPVPRPPPRTAASATHPTSPIPAVPARKSISLAIDEDMGSFEREVMDALMTSESAALSQSSPVPTPPRQKATGRPPSTVVSDVSPPAKRSGSATASGGERPVSLASADESKTPVLPTADISSDASTTLAVTLENADENMTNNVSVTEDDATTKPKKIPGVFSNQSGHGAMAAMAAAMKGRTVPPPRPFKPSASPVSAAEYVDAGADAVVQVGLRFSIIFFSSFNSPFTLI